MWTAILNGTRAWSVRSLSRFASTSPSPGPAGLIEGESTANKPFSAADQQVFSLDCRISIALLTCDYLSLDMLHQP
jgi:hypothetical protein